MGRVCIAKLECILHSFCSFHAVHDLAIPTAEGFEAVESKLNRGIDGRVRSKEEELPPELPDQRCVASASPQAWCILQLSRTRIEEGCGHGRICFTSIVVMADKKESASKAPKTHSNSTKPSTVYNASTEIIRPL